MFKKIRYAHIYTINQQNCRQLGQLEQLQPRNDRIITNLRHKQIIRDVLNYWVICNFNFISILCQYQVNLQNQNVQQILFYQPVYIFLFGGTIYYNAKLLIQRIQSKYKVDIIQPMQHIMTQQQILTLTRTLIQAQNQAQVNAVQQKIKKQFLIDKNVNTIVNIIVDKKTQYPTKVVLAFCFNLMVQELLSRYFKIKLHSDRYKNKVHDQIRKEIVNMCSKIQRIIDCNFVPTHVKPNLAYLQLRLYYRNKQQWDILKLCNKMQYFFRKDQPIIAQAYFSNILKMGYSPKQKVQLVKKARLHFPNLAAKALTRILKGQGFSNNKEKSGGYEDFICVFNAMSSLLTNTFFQIQKQVVLFWCNEQIFLSLLRAVIKQVEQPQSNTIKHTQQQIESWRATLLKVLKKSIDYIGHYKIMEGCAQFVKIYLQYIVFIFQAKYIPNIWPRTHQCNNNFIRSYQDNFEEYLPLLINSARYKIFPYYLLSSYKKKQNPEQINSQQNPLNTLQKRHIVNTYVFPIFEYTTKKINKLIINKFDNSVLNKDQGSQKNKQNLEQLVELFEQFCSSEEPDYHSESFLYNYALLLQEIAENYRYIGYFFKKVIVVLLGTWDANTTLQQGYMWVKQQMQLIQQLPKQYDNNSNYKTQMGILLSIILYRFLVKDQNFIKTYIQKFILKVLHTKNPEQIATNNSKGETISKLSLQPKNLFFFIMIFYNYMEQLSLFYKEMHLRIEKWVYNEFIQEIVYELCKKNITQTNEIKQNKSFYNIQSVYMKTLSKYIKLTKKSIKIIKDQPIYKANLAYSYQNTKFRQIQQPLQSFHHYQSVLPIYYYIDIYRDIIDYNSFKMEGQQLENTLVRLQKVLANIVQFYYLNKENKQNNMVGSQSKIYYQHKVFEIFSIVLCEEMYASIFGQIFQWIVDLGANSNTWLKEFQEDLIDMIAKLLRKSHIVLALDQDKLKLLWNIVYMLIGLYQWKPYDPQLVNKSDQSFSHKQILLIYLASTYKTPKQLTTYIYQKTKTQIQKISQTVLHKKRKLQVTRVRPYQHEQLSFLIILHQIILNHHEQFDQQILEEFLGLFWVNFQFKDQFPEDFTYVDGKYNLIVILLMRYQFDKFYAVLHSKGQEIVSKVYHQVFYNDLYYRVCYDVTLFVMSTLDILSFIWSPKYDINKLKYILKNAHFALGGVMICLDRVYQKYRYCKEQQLQIQIFKQKLKDPVLTIDIQMQKMVQYLTNGQPYVDQFQYFRKFFSKIKNNQATCNWFYNSMNLYIKTQVYLTNYLNIMSIHKIRKEDGMIIYRIFKSIKQR